MAPASKPFKYSWEQAIEILRNDPEQAAFIHDAYLGRDLVANSRRFAESAEFMEARAVLLRCAPSARKLLDMPGGNGIATYAFAASGFEVTTVEPNPSDDVGRGAIAKVLEAAGLRADIVDAWGEALPFADSSFDVAYVRQGLHHAKDLPKMISELARILKPGGVLLACREHVVDNYGSSLDAFLVTQIDHQLYGGEHAFTLADYRSAIEAAGLRLDRQFGPYESIINAYPNAPEVLRNKILASGFGRVLGSVLPQSLVVRIGHWALARRKAPGRLYSFLTTKPAV